MANKKNQPWRLPIILVSIVIVLILAAVIGKKMGLIGGQKGLAVSIGKVKQVEIVEKVNASGRILPEVEVKISPDVPGEITELYIQEGDSVKKGDLLLKIRPDNYESVVAKAKASLNAQRASLSQAKSQISQSKARYLQAKQEFERNQSLYKQEVISLKEFQTAKTNMDVAKSSLRSAEQNVEASRYSVVNAEASLEQSRKNLSLTSVHAPIGGVVSKLVVKKGERVVGTSQMQGTEMLRIAELQNMEVRVNVNENDIVRVNLGDTAIVEVDAYGEDVFKGIVTAIANSANSLSSTTDAVTEFQVKVSVLNSSYQHLIKPKRKYPFRPGMTASVEIITERKTNVTAVPLSAVTTRKPKTKEGADIKQTEQKEVVFVYGENRKAVMVEVKTGISDFNYMEILDGLTLGQEIVTGPFLALSKKIQDGTSLKKEEHTKNKKRKR